ncbi:MAG: hypothetical protein AAFQ68_03765 [Bacteroidota bacterium]
MKKFNFLVLFFVAALAFTACQNPEKIIPSNEGTWEAVSITISEFEDGVATVTDSVVTYNGNLTYQFNEDGTGVYTEDNETENFTWLYDSDNEKLTISDGLFPLIFDVVEISKDEMELFVTFELEFLGTVSRTDQTLILRKVE